MVILDDALILAKVLKITDLDEKQKKDALKKIIHLCCSNKYINRIGDLSLLVNISVLYLHENNISKIENLSHNTHLTHLYLQHNGIEKIENVNHLKRLRKLYLGHNKISVVESLDRLENLQELHIENQKLPPGESLYFDPRTVKALSKTLKVLDISSNQITSLDDIYELIALEELDATNNNISDLLPTCKVLAHWRELKTLLVEGNPLTRIGKYAEKITLLTHKLNALDGRIIKDETRSFLQQFEMAKLEKRKTELKHSSQFNFTPDFSSLAEHLPLGIRNSVSRSILKETAPVNKNFSLPKIPIIKELPLEKRLVAQPFRKNFNSRKIKPKQPQDKKPTVTLI
ncbi:protein phosphatase 1 regulatory subunit 42-like [Lycorma delicatula]|uniref:protein phosphatase 1 regulatory subunit 42-like n=1 Tax=Lycorma delicatula TaxID=130591 RepID=UPI003F514211